jgi:hypothetical protein
MKQVHSYLYLQEMLKIIVQMSPMNILFVIQVIVLAEDHPLLFLFEFLLLC